MRWWATVNGWDNLRVSVDGHHVSAPPMALGLPYQRRCSACIEVEPVDRAAQPEAPSVAIGSLRDRAVCQPAGRRAIELARRTSDIPVTFLVL